MLDKLEAIARRFEEVRDELSRPDVVTDMRKFKKLNQEFKELDEIVKAYEAYKILLANIDNAKEMLQEEDEEMRAMAKEELSELESRKEEMDEEIKILMVPKDPEDSKNVMLEIRAGTGGDEASLFAGDLFRMYERFASKKRLESRHHQYHPRYRRRIQRDHRQYLRA
jgi:peptide chain release factor 1